MFDNTARLGTRAPAAIRFHRGPGGPKRTPILLLALAALVAPLLLPAAGDAQTIIRTVGVDAGCDFDDPADAVDEIVSIPATERTVRLQRGLFESVALHVSADQLTLRGGFDGCDAAEPTPGAVTILSGDGSGPVLGLTTLVALSDPPPTQAEPESTFVLDQIELSGGGGSGLRILGPADVLVEDSLILGNEALAGGGIHVDGSRGPTIVELVRTGVNGNRTLPGSSERPDGGGLYCRGGAVVRAGDRTTFVGNATVDEGQGGGVFLDDCDFEATGNVKIQLNRAHHGGGLAATGDSLVTLAGSSTDAVQVTLNRAEERSGLRGRGGGLYVEGRADLLATGVHVEDNRALPEFGDGGGQGGGLFVNAARADLDAETPCRQPCSVVHGNRAARGAAALVTRTGRLGLLRTHVDGNVGEASVFEVSAGTVGSSTLVVRHSFVSRNVAARIFDLVDLYSLRLQHSSVGGNPGVATVLAAGGTGSVRLGSSILFEPGTPLADFAAGVDRTLSCLVASDGSLVGPGSLKTDPLFADAAAGDLHLLETSPAIDLCPNTLGIALDIDGQPVPVDQAVVLDDGTPADAGADEVGFLEPPLFADGFESGDPAAWSLVGG